MLKEKKKKPASIADNPVAPCFFFIFFLSFYLFIFAFNKENKSKSHCAFDLINKLSMIIE
jgi:hypothetical protein